MTKFLTAVLLMLSLSAHADGMKDLFVEALKNGSSEGVMTDDNMVKFVQYATRSKEPIHVKITRIEQFDNGCGRLHTVLDQAGDAGTKGTPSGIDQWFEINICPDGKPPVEKLRAMENKRLAIIAACKVSIEKAGQEKESGTTKATLHATGCPVSGMASWHYTGDCPALLMPAGIGINTPISKDGKVSLEMRIPNQCLLKQNSWAAMLLNKEKQQLGTVDARW